MTMTSWSAFAIAVLAAAAAGLLFQKLRVPSGAMIGSALGMILCSLLLGHVWTPPGLSLSLQFLTGAFIGCKVTREKLLGCLRRPQVILFLIAGMLFFNTISGILLARISSMDLVTALFASAPGGVSDMVIVSGALGADTALVSLIQVTRVLAITCVFPLIYRRIYDWHARAKQPRQPPAAGRGDKQPAAAGPAAQAVSNPAARFLLTLAAAAAGGSCLQGLGVAAGGIIGAALAVILLNLTAWRGYFPPSMGFVLQVSVGVYIGSGVTRETLAAMMGLLLPALLVILLMLVSACVMALLICRFTTLDFMTCLLMCTPGGMQEMAILAGEFDCDMASVVITQTLRVVAVLLLFPGYLSYIVSVFSSFL